MKHPVKMVPGKSVIAEELLNLAKAEGPWVPYFNFWARPVPIELLHQDPFFRWLSTRHNYISGVLRMDPYQQYDWHQDTRRGVGINMLLEHFRSYVLFTETPNELVKNIRPHKYEEGYYYIFNTQVPHSVINLQKHRYLFTVEFEKDKTELTFDELRKDILENYGGKHG